VRELVSVPMTNRSNVYRLFSGPTARVRVASLRELQSPEGRGSGMRVLSRSRHDLDGDSSASSSEDLLDPGRCSPRSTLEELVRVRRRGSGLPARRTQGAKPRLEYCSLTSPRSWRGLFPRLCVTRGLRTKAFMDGNLAKKRSFSRRTQGERGIVANMFFHRCG